MYPFPAEEVVVVEVGKTPYVRLDLNDYSVAHTAIDRNSPYGQRPSVCVSSTALKSSPIMRAATVAVRESKITATSGTTKIVVDRPNLREAKFFCSRPNHTDDADFLSYLQPGVALTAGHKLPRCTHTAQTKSW